MTSLLLTASLLLGPIAVDPELDARTEAEPAIAIVDALWLDVTDRTVTPTVTPPVTTVEPMASEDAPAEETPLERHEPIPSD